MLENFKNYEIKNAQTILGGSHRDQNGIPPDRFLR